MPVSGARTRKKIVPANIYGLDRRPISKADFDIVERQLLHL